MEFIKAQKGQFWRRINDHIWVRFIFQIEGERLAHYLEYIPNGIAPYQDSADIVTSGFPNLEDWELISPQKAEQLIENMDQQDAEIASRLSNREKVDNLARALKILERRKISSVNVHQNAIQVSTDNGASYEIAIGKSGFTSRQIGLPDPW
jgi:hypothetical protein